MQLPSTVMLFQLVCAISVACAAAGLLNFNFQGGSRPNNNNNRIRDTFMSGVLRGKNTPCNGTGFMSLDQGECKPAKECKKQGGTTSGTCALVGSCCIIENTCGNTTSAKVSYFTNPMTVQPMCALTITPYSPNVCQIRLDFVRFDIEGPVPPMNPPAPVPPTPSPLCMNDTFTVMGSMANLGFDALCGDLTGQHIYIPVNNAPITLQFMIQALANNPNWRIKITQLECTTTIQDYSSLQSALTSLYSKHKGKKNPSNDRDMIAPPGCLQYYTEPTGNYKSFNYNNGQGPMIGNLNYAICFKMHPSQCGITHTFEKFALSKDGLDTDSCRLGDQDWLYIPGSESPTIVPPQTDDYYCGIVDMNTVVSSRPHGPLYVGVRSDEFSTISAVGQIPQDGFSVNYSPLTNCA